MLVFCTRGEIKLGGGQLTPCTPKSLLELFDGHLGINSEAVLTRVTLLGGLENHKFDIAREWKTSRWSVPSKFLHLNS